MAETFGKKNFFFQQYFLSLPRYFIEHISIKISSKNIKTCKSLAQTLQQYQALSENTRQYFAIFLTFLQVLATLARFL